MKNFHQWLEEREPFDWVRPLAQEMAQLVRTQNIDVEEAIAQKASEHGIVEDFDLEFLRNWVEFYLRQSS